MEQVSEDFFNYLSSIPEFISVMDKRLFPLVANENTEFPFCIYKIEQQNGITKDSGKESDISLFAYFGAQKYKSAIQFNDAIVEKINESNVYNYQDSSIDFIEENQSIVLLISIKK